MSTLSHRDRELVALGAALAANCQPCIEYHVPEARRAGLSDAEIREAIELADKIKRVPANKVLDAAQALLGASAPTAEAACCAPTEKATAGDACCSPAMMQAAQSACCAPAEAPAAGKGCC